MKKQDTSLKRTIRYTSSKLNKGKLNILQEIDRGVLILKNEMSSFIFKNLRELIFNKKLFLKNYKIFKTSYLSAWETQTLFTDICVTYETMYNKYIDNKNTFIQNGYFVKDGFFDIIRKKNETTKLVKYGLKGGKVDEKYLRTIEFIRNNIFLKIKKITFNTGTHFKSPCENGTSENTVILETDNTKYKYFVKYKLPERNKYVYLPLDWNERYHFKTRTQMLVKMGKRKVHLLGTYDGKKPEFKNGDIVGVDVNVKNNLFTLSDGTIIDLNREYYKKFLKDLRKVDKTKNEKHRRKLILRNEWYFKLKCSELLDYCESKNISEIVVEDLNISGKGFVKNEEFEIKYSRLIKLLRINNIKNWLLTQAEKRGIKVHIAHSEFTSQQCICCGNINKGNRKTQEQFCCLECGFSTNADLNASINIKGRLIKDVPCKELHNRDIYGRLIPKRLFKGQIRNILEEGFG